MCPAPSFRLEFNSGIPGGLESLWRVFRASVVKRGASLGQSLTCPALLLRISFGEKLEVFTVIETVSKQSARGLSKPLDFLFRYFYVLVAVLATVK